MPVVIDAAVAVAEKIEHRSGNGLTLQAAMAAYNLRLLGHNGYESASYRPKTIMVL